MRGAARGRKGRGRGKMEKKKEKKKPAGLRSNINQRQCDFGVFFYFGAYIVECGFGMSDALYSPLGVVVAYL